MADVFYASSSELATLTNTFSVNGVATDPTTVSLTVTTPSGTATTYTYAGGTVTKSTAGVYTKDIACSEDGLWTYSWAGTGAASDVADGTWKVFPAERWQYYTSLETLRLALGITDTDRDALLLQNLAAAARSIDAYTGRRFYADTSATARLYRPLRRTNAEPDGDVLIVDDISTATGLVVETGTAAGSTWTTVAATSYETSPDNAITLGRPITGLRRIYSSWSRTPIDRVRVTARWGWPTVPDVVVQATTLQAARLYRRKDSPEGVLGSAEWGAIRVSRIDPDVQALIGHLVLPGFA